MVTARARRYASAILDTYGIGSRGRRAVAGVLPVVVALSWLPLRSHLPNTDLALVLVVVLAGVGFLGGRAAAAVGALGAGLSFDLLHTPPYGRLAIHSGRDVLTTAFLVVAGLITGEVAVRLRRYRSTAESEAGAFALVTDAASLVATGGETSLVIEAVAAELVAGLALDDCRFAAGPPRGDVPFIGRDGRVVRLDGPTPAPAPDRSMLDLPVWSSGEIAGRFQLVLGTHAALSPAQVQLAIGLADQAGAALRAEPPDGPPDGPDEPPGGPTHPHDPPDRRGSRHVLRLVSD